MYVDVKGTIQLPDSKTMWTDIGQSKTMHEARFTPSLRQYLFVDYIPFMDELGRMIGCTPPNFCKFAVT